MGYVRMKALLMAAFVAMACAAPAYAQNCDVNYNLDRVKRHYEGYDQCKFDKGANSLHAGCPNEGFWYDLYLFNFHYSHIGQETVMIWDVDFCPAGLGCNTSQYARCSCTKNGSCYYLAK